MPGPNSSHEWAKTVLENKKVPEQRNQTTFEKLFQTEVRKRKKSASSGL